jgi:hypothetical protein
LNLAIDVAINIHVLQDAQRKEHPAAVTLYKNLNLSNQLRL